jgi:carbonic anhydrase
VTLPAGTDCTIDFNYKSSVLTLLNNGHAFQADVGEGNSIRAGKKSYALLQFHFHVPSEHFMNNRDFDFEIHFVHQAEDRSLAVVGVFGRAKRGHSENDAIKLILAQAPREGDIPLVNRPKDYSKPFSIETLLPPKGRRAHYTYSGSLTTPPCSEGVTWHMMRYVLPISSAQLKELRAMIGGKNARRVWQGPGVPPVMQLNRRTIQYCRDLSTDHMLPHLEN